MPEEITLLLVFIVGLAAGFIDSTSGAGGFISIPALVLLGLPPQVAIATDRLGTIGQSVTATFKFWKAKKIVWAYVPALVVISLIGSTIGAKILIDFDPELLQKAVGALLLILLPLVFLKQNIGVKRGVVSKSKKISGLAIYFFISIFGGFLGQIGTLTVYNFTYFLRLTIIEVIATGLIPWFVLLLTSLTIFARGGIIDYTNGIILLIGMAIGGYIGAHIALKKGEEWVKRLFTLFVILSSIKLLFF